MSSAQFTQGYEKASSRVLRPPGGGSSNIFGAGAESQAAAGDTSNAPKQEILVPSNASENRSAADYKNRQQSSSIFDSDEKASPAVNKQPADVQVEAEKEPEQQEDEEKEEEQKDAATETCQKNAQQEKDVNMAKAQRGAFNPITGEAYPSASGQVHTSTKVRQPPGGASSGLW